MSRLGITPMLKSLIGNEETVEAIKSSLNKTIEKVWLDKGKDCLKFRFEDETQIKVWDGGQCCCEHRYMVTDDELSYYSGSKLLDMELKDAPEMEDEWGVHEVQFLDIKTDKGIFQMANHNEHNG